MKKRELQEKLSLPLWVVDSLAVGVLMEDAARRIVYVNGALCDLFDVADPDALLGMVYEDFAARAKATFAVPGWFVESGAERVAALSPFMGEELGLADGGKVERHYIPVFAEGVLQHHLWLYRNTSEGMATTAALKSGNSLLNAIADAQSRFIADGSLHTLFGEMLESLLVLTNSEYGFIGDVLYTAEGSPYFKMHSISGSAWKRMTHGFYARNAPIGMEFYRRDTLVGTVLASGKAVISNRPGADSRRGGLPQGHPPLDSFLGLPFFSRGKLAGIVGLANRPEGYDGELVEYLEPLLVTCGNLVEAYNNNQWRKEVESQLRRQALVFENISDGVILTDWEGIIVDCNPAAEKMFGFSKRELLGMPLDFLGGGEQSVSYTGEAIAAVKQRGRWSETLRFLHKDGREGIYETSVLPLRDQSELDSAIVWLNRDITERKLAQIQLEERTLKLDAILALSPDGFVFIDRTGKVAYVNPAFEQMTGLRGEALMGADRSYLDNALKVLCHADGAYPPATHVSQAGADTLCLARPRPTILKRIIRDMRDRTGNLQGIVQYYHDVTQQTEVDRMKSEFLSTAAHELRTPMASVFGFAELLLTQDFDEERRREFTGIIYRQAGNLTSLLNELLDLARIEARAGKDFKIIEQPLAPIIHSTVAELLVPNDARKVSLSLPDGLPSALVDGEKLQLALTNVLSNAYKYSLGKGEISLTVKLRGEGAREQVGILVRDQGVGMSEEQRSRVFERFYRADTSGKIPGTGLGMSLVKEIMDIFGGDVEIRSKLGDGTEVALWLPVAAQGVQGE